MECTLALEFLLVAIYSVGVIWSHARAMPCDDNAVSRHVPELPMCQAPAKNRPLYAQPPFTVLFSVQDTAGKWLVSRALMTVSHLAKVGERHTGSLIGPLGSVDRVE